MIVKRNKIFETNSSSTHSYSVVVAPVDIMNKFTNGDYIYIENKNNPVVQYLEDQNVKFIADRFVERKVCEDAIYEVLKKYKEDFKYFSSWADGNSNLYDNSSIIVEKGELYKDTVIKSYLYNNSDLITLLDNYYADYEECKHTYNCNGKEISAICIDREEY